LSFPEISGSSPYSSRSTTNFSHLSNVAFLLFSYYLYRRISEQELPEKVEQASETTSEALRVPLPPSPEKTNSTQEDIIDIEELDEDNNVTKSLIQPVEEEEEENTFEFAGEEEEEQDKENVPIEQNTLPPLELKPKTKASPRTRIKLEEGAITPQKRPTRVIRSPYRYSPDGVMVSNDAKRKSSTVKIKQEQEEEETVEKVRTRSSVRTEERSSSPKKSPRKASTRSTSKSPARKKKAEASPKKSPSRSRKEESSPKRSPARASKSPGRGTPGRTRGRKSEIERLLS